MFVNFNGKILNESKAVVSVNNRSFRYGDGCFETMKYYHDKLLLSDYHFDRLFTSLLVLQFDCPSFFTKEYLLSQIHELVQTNQHQKIARIRLTIFRGNGGLFDPENMTPNWLIQSWPLSETSSELNANGLVIGIYKNGFKAADAFANLKSNNYLLYSQAALFAKHNHWNDALVLNHRTTVADATIANLFLIKENSVITSPLTDGPVNGVMRRHLIEHLSSLGFEVIEQSIDETNIEDSDEAFLSNAVYGIKWVQSIDGKEFPLNHSAHIYKHLISSLNEG